MAKDGFTHGKMVDSITEKNKKKNKTEKEWALLI